LRLDPTLTCGQAFRWKPTGDNEWTCSLWNHAVALKQTPDTVLYRSLGSLDMEPVVDLEAELRDYFQLSVSFESLCSEWSQRDPHFSDLGKSQQGVRTLRQPVVENLFTFIATSNNNIKRITMLIDKLCVRYGTPIVTELGTAFHTFPTIAQMAKDCDMEDTLKELGFGYRAKYYAKTVEMLTRHSDPEQFLLSLRNQSFENARAELMKFSGVGPKVADCVCLMSLDKIDAVPIDTHIWQVAQKRYIGRILGDNMQSGMNLPAESKDQIVELARQLKTHKTAGNKAYELAQQLFIKLFSPYAGWAQGLLFSGDLEPKDKKKPDAKKPAASKRKHPLPDIAAATDTKQPLRRSTRQRTAK
ncbi:8-oxoguanine glycosylase ogg1, partial [Linderina macrospora]